MVDRQVRFRDLDRDDSVSLDDELLVRSVADGRTRQAKVSEVTSLVPTGGGDNDRHVGTTPPANPNVGDEWYKTDSNELRAWNGSAWDVIGPADLSGVTDAEARRLANQALTRNPPAGGTDGQILTKQSGTDYDYDWENAPDDPTGAEIVSAIDAQLGRTNWQDPPTQLRDGAETETLLDTEIGDAGWRTKATNTNVDGVPSTMADLSNIGDTNSYDDTNRLTVKKAVRLLNRVLKRASTTQLGVVLMARAQDVAATLTDTSRVPTVANVITLVNRLIPDNRKIPSGGASGQVLAKTSNTDYAVGWSTPTTGTGGITSVASDDTLTGDGTGGNPLKVAVPFTTALLDKLNALVRLTSASPADIHVSDRILFLDNNDSLALKYETFTNFLGSIRNGMAVATATAQGLMSSAQFIKLRDLPTATELASQIQNAVAGLVTTSAFNTSQEAQDRRIAALEGAGRLPGKPAQAGDYILRVAQDGTATWIRTGGPPPTPTTATVTFGYATGAGLDIQNPQTVQATLGERAELDFPTPVQGLYVVITIPSGHRVTSVRVTSFPDIEALDTFTVSSDGLRLEQGPIRRGGGVYDLLVTVEATE